MVAMETVVCLSRHTVTTVRSGIWGTFGFHVMPVDGGATWDAWRRHGGPPRVGSLSGVLKVGGLLILLVGVVESTPSSSTS